MWGVLFGRGGKFIGGEESGEATTPRNTEGGRNKLPPVRVFNSRSQKSERNGETEEYSAVFPVCNEISPQFISGLAWHVGFPHATPIRKQSMGEACLPRLLYTDQERKINARLLFTSGTKPTLLDLEE